MKGPNIIKGSTHSDSRGIVHFINEFNMTKVVRMYCIEPAPGVVRAWQGHEIESKWFFVVKGSFRVKTISIENPLRVTEHSLNEGEVLHIPCGHYNGFEATADDSILMIFSDVSLEISKADDLRKTLEFSPWN